MKLTLEVALLADMLDLANRFIAKSSTLPILQNVYLQVQNNELTIKATDMEKYIHITLPVDQADDGWTTVDAKTLYEILKTLDENIIELRVDATDMLTITTAKDSFSIKGIPTQEFVALPEIQPLQTINLPISDFTTGIAKVEFAVLEKNFSPVFTGIVIGSKKEEEKTSLIFVGTDSFRLAEYKILSDQSYEDFKIIIPKSSINDMKRVGDYCLNKQANNHVTLHYANNMVLCEFTIGTMNIKTNSLLIQGNFPDYDNEKIVPKHFSTTVTVDTSSTDKAIRKVGILTKDINNFIQLTSDNNIIELNSGTTAMGQANTSLSAIINGENINVGVNGKHISDFLRITNSDRVNMNFVNNDAPIVLTEPENTNYKYVIRPIKR
jgi:DNA polymerase-3 subunit beta